MKRSTQRILTTHTGSLPRPDYLLELVTTAPRGPVADATRPSQVRKAVAEIVRKQADHGIDVINDGEMGKESYSTYVRERLTGFEGAGEQAIGMPDMAEFPAYTDKFMREMGPAVGNIMAPPACIGPIQVRDREQVVQDVDNLRAAAAEVECEDLFLSAASPGVVALFFANRHYPTREEYVMAIADAMRAEYEAIVAAGIVLQLDCPDLAMGRHIQFADADLDEFREQARLNVEALNRATANIDPDQLRMHLCWGNYEGPHHRDVALKDIIDIVLTARPNGISLESCNPRHDHEWAVFEDVSLPEGKVLIPGVVDSTNNYIEHPELVAQRLVRFARLVGKENVMAGTDCGFGTAAGLMTVDPDIAWAKFDAMAEGARLAGAVL
ncbi:cobalamin-independent methionine synthase II family protein [Pseudonocardia asaccharolytica]|uniref:Methionine synthase n=1 Tax=Pseudonocardia asaccharolytica DSM 44247 = NBRC 16224 TaxID=1123024 RepID=A0A511CYF9_9PSEU|nr:cobalamin-independent methionine synthase II family protein [Pseudonocardia asaccharolytica]GEL17599.1 methionine synthase [Pseudonocardia asaccharolytica DSM 44247 = NBRC 16224]